MQLPFDSSMFLPLIWLGVALSLLMMRRSLLGWARRSTALSATHLDQDAVNMLSRLYVPAGLLAGGYFTLQVVPLSARWQSYGERTLGVLATLVAVWVGWRALSLLLHYWAATNPNAQTMVPPVQLFAKVVGAVVGLALVLSALGFSLTKVWTALGIGSVAIALALQETLSNSFAGFHIMLDQPFRVGDYIKMDTGEEGRVIQIGWRSTRLHTGVNNILVVPNSKMGRASITNFSLPQPRLVVTIEVPVSQNTNPRQAKKALEEIASAALSDVDGILPEPPPQVRFTSVADNALKFTITMQVRDFAAQVPVQDELRCRIVEKFQQDKIELASGAALGIR